MTKKSKARQQRDLALKEEEGKIIAEGRKGWDEVMNLSNAVLTALTVPMALKEPLRNKVLLSHLSKEEGMDCADKVRLLDKDLQTMIGKFKEIRGKHANRTGREKNFAEVFETYEIVTQYQQFQAELDAFILPTKGDIIQHISNAEHRMATLEQKRQAEAEQAAQAAATTETATA